MTDLNGVPLVAGDVVIPRDGRFAGCVLTLIGWEAQTQTFTCRNSYGNPRVIAGEYVNVIDCRTVDFYRHAR